MTPIPAIPSVSKSMQELRTGRYEKSTLKELEYKPETTKSFIIESARRDASGAVISESRVITSETFNKAAEGMLKQEGTDVSYQACFAAGTLVHTDKGLIPIEQVRVGTRVLSQPELGGALDYRRVTDRIATLDQIVFAVQVKPERSDAPLMTLITTHGHPFWVETPAQDPSANTNGIALDKADKAKHWVAAEQLAVGQILQLADGTRALVRATGVVHKTQHADIGFVASNDAPTGIVLSLPTEPNALNEPIVPASAERIDALENAGPLQLAEPLRVTVYNLTVDEFHTYYVADLGVWVHNTYWGPEAVKTVFTIAEDIAAIKEGQSPACFVAGTLVHTKEGLKPIEQIQVGDLVLSYPDDQPIPTGKFREPHEYTYKRVVQTFVTENQPVTEFPVLNLATGNIERLTATPNHPIYVKGEGWITLEVICARRQLVTVETCDFRNLVFGGLYKDKGLTTVYNIEVEDFHTYYVGTEGLWVHNCDPHSTGKITNLQKLLDFVKTGEGKIEIYRA